MHDSTTKIRPKWFEAARRAAYFGEKTIITIHGVDVAAIVPYRKPEEKDGR
jgi:antitoxin (DNA-binding transcriptional repressor) of toxin-antitoxin stability system